MLKRHLKNQKGIAVIEAVPLIVIFTMLLTFGLGFYGAIHTATLHSIAARTYAFETFRQRTNLTFLREEGSGENAGAATHYKKKGFRYHGVSHELDQRLYFVSTLRPISIDRGVAEAESDGATHNQKVFDLQRRNQAVGVNPIWIMVGYGICIDSRCGN